MGERRSSDLFTTNLTMSQLERGYGGAVLSLLREKSVVFEFTGEDFRPKANRRELLDEIAFGRSAANHLEMADLERSLISRLTNTADMARVWDMGLREEVSRNPSTGRSSPGWWTTGRTAIVPWLPPGW